MIEPMKKTPDMTVKEDNVTITLFNAKKEVFKNASVIYSASGFIRFKTEKGKYICFSGDFKTERQSN